jgi:hypothetical protein
MWFAKRNIHYDKVLVNFAKFTHTQIKVGLQYAQQESKIQLVIVCFNSPLYHLVLEAATVDLHLSRCAAIPIAVSWDNPLLFSYKSKKIQGAVFALLLRMHSTHR